MNTINVRRSALWMVGAVVAFSLTAISGREATQQLSDSALTVSQLVFFRSIIGLLLISTLIVLRYGNKAREMVSTQRLKIHFGRKIFHTSVGSGAGFMVWHCCRLPMFLRLNLPCQFGPLYLRV